MKCEVCHRGPEQGITLYRVNPKGEIGRWRCDHHMDELQRNGVDPEVGEVVKAIERGRRDQPGR